MARQLLLYKKMNNANADEIKQILALVFYYSYTLSNLTSVFKVGSESCNS